MRAVRQGPPIDVHFDGQPQGYPLMIDFGFQPGIVDYWMLLTDWRNGSFSILAALGLLLVVPRQLLQPGATAIRRASFRVSILAWRAVSSLWRS
jgi:hypothetical protein